MSSCVRKKGTKMWSIIKQKTTRLEKIKHSNGGAFAAVLIFGEEKWKEEEMS